MAEGVARIGGNTQQANAMTDQPESESAEEFDLEAFLPFILNQIAEETGKAFQSVYRAQYGFSRTQWRVLAIVGRYSGMTARDICATAHEEKTRVSRAVAALEAAGHLRRENSQIDKRAEILSLTEAGEAVYEVLGQSALAFDTALRQGLGPDGDRQLRALLQTLCRTVERIG